MSARYVNVPKKARSFLNFLEKGAIIETNSVVHEISRVVNNVYFLLPFFMTESTIFLKSAFHDSVLALS